MMRTASEINNNKFETKTAGWENFMKPTIVISVLTKGNNSTHYQVHKKYDLQ